MASRGWFATPTGAWHINGHGSLTLESRIKRTASREVVSNICQALPRELLAFALVPLNQEPEPSHGYSSATRIVALDLSVSLCSHAPSLRVRRTRPNVAADRSVSTHSRTEWVKGDAGCCSPRHEVLSIPRNEGVPCQALPPKQPTGTPCRSSERTRIWRTVAAYPPQCRSARTASLTPPACPWLTPRGRWRVRVRAIDGAKQLTGPLALHCIRVSFRFRTRV
jgi:hypothetical protein